MKTINDFPDLINNIYNNITIQHFSNGLNTNFVIEGSTEDYSSTITSILCHNENTNFHEKLISQTKWINSVLLKFRS